MIVFFAIHSPTLPKPCQTHPTDTLAETELF